MTGHASLARNALTASICIFCLLLPLSIAGANIGWGIILASLLAYRASGGSLPLSARHSALEKPLWVYFAVSVITAICGVNLSRSAGYLHQDFHKVWLYLLFSVALTADSALPALGCMAMGFTAASLIGLGQVSAALAKTGQWERAHAFVHPVTFGEQISIALLGGVCLLLNPAGLLTRSWHKTAAWAFLLLTAMALAFSGTRGALMGVATAIAALWLVLPQWRLRAFSGIGLILITGCVSILGKVRWGSSLAEEIAQWRHTGILSTNGQLMRLTLWKVAWRMGLDHPWMGVGLNNYRVLFRRYFTGTLDAGAADWGTAHNLYLHQFAERGILGAAALAWLLWAFWSRALQRVRRTPDFWNLWAFATATAFLIMNFTEVALQVEIVWMLVFFVWIWAETRFARLEPK